MSIFEPPWPEMSEQMSGDREGGRNHNFRATFTNPDGHAAVPDGTLGTCWKAADFAKKESSDYGMWLFKPDNNENIYYCEAGDLNLSPRWPDARDALKEEWDRAATRPRNEALEKHGAALDTEITEQLWRNDNERTRAE